MLPFNLSEELLKWKEEYGTEKSSSYGVPYKYIDWAKTKDLVTILVERLKELGAEKPYFQKSKIKNQIAEACTGPKSALSKKAYSVGMIRGWEALDIALFRVYGTDGEHFEKHGKAAESVENEENPVEVKIKSELDKEAENKIDLPRATRTAQNTVIESAPPAQELKEFDPSTSDVPDPEDVVDPEMAEILEYK